MGARTDGGLEQLAAVLAAPADLALASADWLDAAEAIVMRGLWCAVEVCPDIARQRWEPRALICRGERVGIAAAVAGIVAAEPGLDARIAGYTRDGLRRVDDAPVALCHLAYL